MRNCLGPEGGGVVRRTDPEVKQERAHIVVHIKGYYGFLWDIYEIRDHGIATR